MKRRIGVRIGVAALAFMLLGGLIWTSPVFAPTAVEYIAGPFPVKTDQTVRVTLFNVTDRPTLVVIALVDITDGTSVGGTKSVALDPRKGTTQDFLMEEEGILIGLVRMAPPRQPAGRDLLPGATLHVIASDGAILSTNHFVASGDVN